MTAKPQIRRATAEDATALAKAGTRLFLQAYDGLISSQDMAAHLADDFNAKQQQSELTDPAIATLIVESGKDVIGFAQLRKNPIPITDAEDAETELWRIYVDQDWHGKGIAQRLIRKLGETARTFLGNGIWLAVWEQNSRAISFYRKIGFKPVGHQEFKVNTEIQNDVVMRATLDTF